MCHFAKGGELLNESAGRNGESGECVHVLYVNWCQATSSLQAIV